MRNGGRLGKLGVRKVVAVQQTDLVLTLSVVHDVVQVLRCAVDVTSDRSLVRQNKSHIGMLTVLTLSIYRTSAACLLQG